MAHNTNLNYHYDVNSKRQLVVKDIPFSGKSVIYIMSRDQRVQDNHALLAAQNLAVANGVPLYVLFILRVIQNRSYEHYEFMLDGLCGVADSLRLYDIPFVLRAGDSATEITRFSEEVESGALFFDFSPLKHSRSLIKRVASSVDCRVTVVDTHNIIPVWIASTKLEVAAHTMRRKVHQQLETYLVTPPTPQRHPYPTESVATMSWDEAKVFIASIPKSGITIRQKSGEKEAHKHLGNFIVERLEGYTLLRNDIAEDRQSGLSPYLHFGHISSMRVALDVMNSAKKVPLLLEEPKLAQPSGQPGLLDGMNALLEEMIVRKELADNFCFYSEEYVTLKAAPNWAQNSLAEHAPDVRDYIYSVDEWEDASTHDEIWNAAQLELKKCGKMHGYMRMYWAKKILEWSINPEEALKTAIYLNDKYSIDGGDPNGYVGILWSIAGLHDRPWFERPVFGKIRYMNAAGLRRKFDVDEYIKRIAEL